MMMDRRIDDVRSKAPLEWGEVGGFTEQQISAAGRALADRSAEACNVDKDDNWKIYGDDFIEDARAAIRALASQPMPPSHLTLDWMGQEAQAHLDGLDADIARAAPPVQQTGDVRDLHAEIMNLPCNPETSDLSSITDAALRAYQVGHRDARHAAAELASAALATTRPSAALTDDKLRRVMHEAYTLGKVGKTAEFYELVNNTCAILAASGGAHAVPDGFVVVPKEATEAMLRAAVSYREIDADDEITDPWANMVDRIYRAMIAAAPTQDQGEGK